MGFWCSRWLLPASLVLVAMGMVILVGSLHPNPAETAATAAESDWHTATHAAGAIFVPGLALHPGPEVATLAAELAPATTPASIVAVALSPVAEATPGLVASPRADQTARDQ